MKQGFNFLKPQVEPPSVWTKVYDWVIGTAKVVLMIAIVAVVVAMGMRIVLDVQSNELDQQISNLETLMGSRQKEETKYRDLQSRIAAYNTTWTSTDLTNPILEKINNMLPLSAKELHVTLVGNALTVTGVALNSDIDTMEAALKLDTTFTQATLSKLETNGDTNTADNSVNFNFQATVSDFAMKSFPTTVTPTVTVKPTP